MRCALRKNANFIRHHRKAAALFSCTRRFNRSIERQKVGLLSNIADDI
ncbi:Uncharacterised protein [Vibrio cholerae]|nr:Uncharacterised protein [Vibrio cholerae]